jgi:hypothetical protein
LRVDHRGDLNAGQPGIDDIEDLLERIEYLYLSARRRIGRNLASELSQGSGQPLVDRVVDKMTKSHLLVELIYKGSPGTSSRRRRK